MRANRAAADSLRAKTAASAPSPARTSWSLPGATPNADGSNFAAAGLTPTRRIHPRNDRLETNVPGIYALGDVKGGPAFTHISYDDYRIIQTNLIDGGKATKPIGWCRTRCTSIHSWVGLASQKRKRCGAGAPFMSRRWEWITLPGHWQPTNRAG